ncbi:MAG TPA: sporulation integral membrane protein YtvI [Firmicutes bacterium]|jgi:sporulation integral membrane protein YtvI|nr:sporulation integral membrane protein YtvI [Bacillota bacterium]
MRQFFVSLLSLTVFLLLFVWFVLYAIPYVLPFLIAVPLAALIRPIAKFLRDRFRLPRSWAAGGSLIIVLGVAACGVILVVARLVGEAASLYSSIPMYYRLLVDQTVHWLDSFGTFANTSLEFLPPSLAESLYSQLSDLYGNLRNMLSTTLEWVVALPSVVGNIMLTLAVACLTAFFLVRDQEMLSSFALSLLPDQWEDAAWHLQREVLGGAIGFLKAQLIIVLITTVLTSLGLWIMGADYALILGICAGVLDLVPFLGPTAILAPWACFMLMQGNLAFGIQLLALLGVLTLVRQIVEPKIVGDRLGVHPLAILLSMYIAVRVFGVVGFVVGPLGAVMVKALAEAGAFPVLGGPNHSHRG